MPAVKSIDVTRAWEIISTEIDQAVGRGDIPQEAAPVVRAGFLIIQNFFDNIDTIAQAQRSRLR